MGGHWGLCGGSQVSGESVIISQGETARAWTPFVGSGAAVGQLGSLVGGGQSVVHVFHALGSISVE